MHGGHMRIEGHEVTEGLHVQDEGGLTAGLIHTDREGWRVGCAGAMQAPQRVRSRAHAVLLAW